MGGATRLPAASREMARSPPGPVRPAPAWEQRARQAARHRTCPRTWVNDAARPPAVAPSRTDFDRRALVRAGHRVCGPPAMPAAKAAARGAEADAIRGHRAREGAGCARALRPSPRADRAGRGLRSRGGAAGGESGAAVTGGSLSPGQWIGSSTPVGGRCGRGADSVRSAGSTRGVASGFGAGSGCSGHMVSSPSGTARGSVSVAVAGRPGANVAPAARTMFCSITTSVGPPMMRRCSTLSRRMRISRRRLSIAAWSIMASRG